MEKLRADWKKTPTHVRKPIVFVIGIFVVLCSGLIGWLPGPGGIPLFLIGIAILSSEFSWAERVKRFILTIVYSVGRWYHRNRMLGTVVLIMSLCVSTSITIMLFLK